MARSRSAAPPTTTPQATAQTTAGARKSRRSTSAAATVTSTVTSTVTTTVAAHRVDRSDVLVSAVISTYLLTHLHHVLQRAEYGAQQEGHPALAANYAQLRKVLCLDARTMEDACAHGTPEDGDTIRAA